MVKTDEEVYNPRDTRGKFQQYVENMAKPKKRGGQMEVIALAAALKCRVEVQQNG
jgi:hypothetical protein